MERMRANIALQRSTDRWWRPVQAGWSFTGPPPGLPAHPSPFHFYQAYPPMGMPAMPPIPHMHMPMQPPRPNMPPTRPSPSPWMGHRPQGFQMNPAVQVSGPGAQPSEKKYVCSSPSSRRRSLPASPAIHRLFGLLSIASHQHRACQ